MRLEPDGLAVDDDHRAVGLARERDLGDRRHDGGIDQAGHDRQREEECERRPELVPEEGGHVDVTYARCRADTMRSIALIPMKGAMIPPSP